MGKKKRKGVIPYLSYAISWWVRNPQERRHWWMVQVKLGPGKEWGPVFNALRDTRAEAHECKRVLVETADKSRRFRVRKVVLA